ncbi:MAG TPA: ATP-binding protein [Burkholderiales bacterium]|nr:ATP-binding protein [Burkholderiales bacterium]
MTVLRFLRPAEGFDRRRLLGALQAARKGDFSVRMPADLTGLDAEIVEAFNDIVRMNEVMVAQFARIRDKVGRDGRIDERVEMPTARGGWADCVESLNTLIGDLVRPVSEVTRVIDAVAKGDLLTRFEVDARGEFLVLKEKINDLVEKLADPSRRNTELDWLKTSFANLSRKLAGHRDLVAVSKLLLAELAPLVNAQQGAVYTRRVESDEPRFDLLVTSAATPGTNPPVTLHSRERLIEQCAAEKKRIVLNDVPAGHQSARRVPGEAAPTSVTIMPVLFEGEVKAVIELFACGQFSEAHLTLLEQLTGSIGIVFNTIEATMRTEHLLVQSRTLTAELQSRQEELQRTNRELEEKARQLSEQMRQVEYKNSEIEQAKAALEDKAEQLALSSRFKSEFLANMSHELRTPLNSLLILAQMLAENPAGNLAPKQIEYAQTICTAGNDLLALINDVLDLAKVESGTVILNIGNERFPELHDYLDRAFRQVGHDKDLQFSISMQKGLPRAIRTDSKRLRQILKNLLSNAFRFTPRGAVSLEVAMASSGWTPGHPVLDAAQNVVAFSVIDTGIGVPSERQQVIFEAFRQADGTTSRHFGGTGLGLSISAKLSQLLGGQIRVKSNPGVGSRFTLYLPLSHAAEGADRNDAEVAGGDAPPPRRRAASRIAQPMPELAGRAVLLIDDDVRNIFALTGALEMHGMIVINAENGVDGIETLKNGPEIDIILMDMMMPELNGYDTIRAMRAFERFRQVPIIGVSAKAMKGDREKAVEAGATDYISKPVNVEHLLSLMRECLAGGAR